MKIGDLLKEMCAPIAVIEAQAKKEYLPCESFSCEQPVQEMCLRSSWYQVPDTCILLLLVRSCCECQSCDRVLQQGSENYKITTALPKMDCASIISYVAATLHIN
jgi:hypothetical protein